MPILTRDDRAVLFVHVPKTGGTSIEVMLENAGWDLTMKSTPRLDPETFRYHRISPQHYHADLLRQTLRIDRFDAVFMLVRDPVARFRSEYAMRSRRHGRSGRASDVMAWAETVFDKYERNPNVLDNHLRPQHEFLLRRAEVFSFEDGLDTVASKLNERFDLGLSGRPPRRMQSAARGHLGSGDVEISTELRTRLREFYAEDFATFGY